MDETSERFRRERSRSAQNEEFLRRLFTRRPEARERYQRLLAEPEAVPEVMMEASMQREDAGLPRPSAHELVAETIVNEERPVLFVRDDWLDLEHVTAIGVEAEDLIRDLKARRELLMPLMPLIGRIDVTDFPGSDFVGSGWVIDTDIVVTNRHVAGLIARWDGRKFAFTRGIGGRMITSSFNTLHEFDDLAADASRAFAVTKVLYIEPENGPDIAFLRIARRTDGTRRDRIAIATTDIGEDVPVCVVGYPARAPKRVIPNQDLMKRLYLDRYDVKRAAPGLSIGAERGSTRHDCTTLGGNSGSVVLNMKTGDAVGLHFAGLYQEANYAVRASELSDYVKRKRWNQPFVVETYPLVRLPAVPKPNPPAVAPAPQPQAPASAAQAAGGAVTVTIPLSITVSLGQAVSAGAVILAQATSRGIPAPAPPPNPAEAAVRAFWEERPQGVIAARVGFVDQDGAIGDAVFVAAAVPAYQLDAAVSQGPTEYRGLPVHYLPANVAEQIDSGALVESVDSISYDDDARTGDGFSFDPVEEQMMVRAHVGPEYSWEELEGFLAPADRLVSAIYEFHGRHIKDAIEARLQAGASLTMVLDNGTFSEIRHEEEEFDRVPVFKRWKSRFADQFERVIAPEGRTGLISDAYHIKVTVRDDDTFWLSSGNWKMSSSQPVITQEERDNVAEVDLPGNREWHVIIRNRTLASRFRNHILQDFRRSRNLGGEEQPPRERETADVLVDVAIEEAPVEERRPPDRVLKPHQVDRVVRAKPLLTPDQEGAVYSEAVLKLIRSARRSLLFQIPYIAIPSNPRQDRGFIDELIMALAQKLRTLDDARLLLRSGGSKFSAPTHAAWYFKSKGIDINARLRSIENHHTKGMIVDGGRVLIGSHNWSKPGVSLNRDASLIVDDEEIARYFTQAFEIDWERANPIRPKRFVRPEAVIQEAVGTAPPPGFRRVRLSDLLREDD
jgi:PLD-like domain/Trypsin-like peptidase domain